MRVDHPGGPLVPIPMKVEYDVYERLWTSPIPVAEPLWYAEGLAVFDGLPHMVRRLVDGAASVPGLTTSGEGGRSCAERSATRWPSSSRRCTRSTGGPTGSTRSSSRRRPGRALTEEIRHWRPLWAESRTDPFPMITEATYWLEEQLPPGGDRLSLLKGNNGVGEEIWKDGRIVALSDWELASIGEPALDWAFSRACSPCTTSTTPWRTTPSTAGFEIDRRRLAWSVVWIRIKASMTTNGGLRGFLDGRDNRVVRPALGSRS